MASDYGTVCLRVKYGDQRRPEVRKVQIEKQPNPIRVSIATPGETHNHCRQDDGLQILSSGNS